MKCHELIINIGGQRPRLDSSASMMNSEPDQINSLTYQPRDQSRGMRSRDLEGLSPEMASNYSHSPQPSPGLVSNYQDSQQQSPGGKFFFEILRV